MVHNGYSARQLEKGSAAHEVSPQSDIPNYDQTIVLPCLCVFTYCFVNVVQNQETFDQNFSTRQGKINAAALKVYFHYHIQYFQYISLRCLCIYWSCCYQNVVQNKDTLLENVSVRVREKLLLRTSQYLFIIRYIFCSNYSASLFIRLLPLLCYKSVVQTPKKSC